jgi:hypothetical protein
VDPVPDPLLLRKAIDSSTHYIKRRVKNFKREGAAKFFLFMFESLTYIALKFVTKIKYNTAKTTIVK